ncbi:ATP-binding protein [Desulfosarcina ovata]|uniref:ATPase AAA n=1 Tax=Desulfosarcina ovata subsp. ovata TaxID=2752305 RepID=A0A5K8AD27_9BACT|nr:DUF499 domain-containing protein [Desulfosarcina ovata]BBO89904.1 hypothetical protein DSCOOX_30840 [Desulfosarcina ovata subsp. ovata]
MPKLKPWYKVVNPREDLREGRPLDASEFAVHLDHIRDGDAHPDYQDPVRFFERTFLTRNLRAVSGEVLRRLNGINTEASSLYNMTTQFGGGKTHSLALLYHLATSGDAAKAFMGVQSILQAGGVNEIPKANVGIFVGTRFDVLTGRGGDDGTPQRRTPWGELAWQLGGEASFDVVREHDAQGIAPAGDVIRKMIPDDKPALLLIDEVMNYVSPERKTKHAGEMYNFLMKLSEEISGMDRVVTVVSIPASELEMGADDEADYTRLKKMLDRKGKPVIMSAENEMSEIIRRRLFEWDLRAVGAEGRLLLPKDASNACREHADWIQDNRNQVPNWFTDHAQDAFEATYPFHPMVISVFERKWRELPRFQQTRGVLRLLALWVSHSFQSGFKGAQRELLIGLGSAPLGDSQFRTAVFEQLGESRLEGAVATDIAGSKESHAVLLDKEAEETLRKACVHQKSATAVFFESNGGQGENRQSATVPELRLAVAGPNIDIGNVETALESLTDRCYYLTLERNSYYFSMMENLNKRYSDRRAGVKEEDVARLVREQVEKVFANADGLERVFFPEKSGQIPNRPVITLAIGQPEKSLSDTPELVSELTAMTKESGSSMRTFKSALIWVVPDNADVMRDDARKLLAWEAIDAEKGAMNLDDGQRRQLTEHLKRARRDLKESVWRSYNKVMLLGKDSALKTVDLGLVTSSSAESLTRLILSTLRQNDEIVKAVSPRFLLKNWPPAKPEWSTKDVRDTFFASPLFPRLLSVEAVQGAIARGVSEGRIAYVAKGTDGYDPFIYKQSLNEYDVEISDDVFIITAEDAEKHIKPPELTRILVTPEYTQVKPGKKQAFSAKGLDQFGRDFECPDLEWNATGGVMDEQGVFQAGEDEGRFLVAVKAKGVKGEASVSVAREPTPAGKKPTTPPPPFEQTMKWSGEIPPQKWMNFYTKVLSKLVSAGGLKITVNVESSPEGGLGERQTDDIRAALRGLGLNDNVE